jgi:hypothetical protein
MMKNFVIFMVTLFSLSAAAKPQNSNFIKVSIGVHTYDDFTFQKRKSLWEVRFIDRSLAEKDQNHARMVPKELVSPILSKLDFFLRKNQSQFKFSEFGQCASRLKVQWGRSVSAQSDRTLCIDGLTKIADQELVAWMNSVKVLFRY